MIDAGKIIRALGNVDEKYIEEASEPGELATDEPGFEPVRVKKKNYRRLLGGCVAAAVAVAAGIAGIAGMGTGSSKSKEAGMLMADRYIDSSTTATASAAAPESAAAETPMTAPQQAAAAEIIEYSSVLGAGAPGAEAPDAGTEEAVAEEAENSFILRTGDNSVYLEKCASIGLVAGVPEYPETVPNPDASFNESDPTADWDAYSAASEAYYDARRKKAELTAGYTDPLKTFTETSAKQFLAGKEDNTVYSPLNVYMALSMLAELTDGESRQQILDLLAMDSIEAVREEARKLWLANYTDDGLTTLVLGSGVWVDSGFNANSDVLNTLVEKYYAFYVSGDMQSGEMSKSFRDWLSEQTHGLLDGFISEEKFDPETVLALAGTIYYKAHWQDVFEEDATRDAVFHALSGDQTVPFMNDVSSGTMSWGDNFSSTSKTMAGGERMYFVLPDEGCITDQVLENPQLWSMLGDDGYENSKYGVIITLSVPKFDVSSGSDLTDGLKKLGVTDVFDDSVSDFSPLTGESGMYVGKVSHNARVKIDEQGVEAAAYTAILVCGSSMPTEYADFICDRPFIFVITNTDGAVLFMGAVNSIE